MKLIAVVVIGAALATWGLLGKSSAERELARVLLAQDQMAKDKAAAESKASETEAGAALLRERVTVLTKDLARAKEDLELVKRSTIDLQAEIRKADDRVASAEEKTKRAAAARQAAEAAAARKGGEAAEARRRLEEEKDRQRAADAEVEAPTPSKAAPSSKAVAACAAIAESINLRTDLTDPEKVSTVYIEWLTSEGGFSARDVVDLGSWIRDVRRDFDALDRMKAEGGRRAEIDEFTDKVRKSASGLMEVRKEFLDGDWVAAKRAFRIWRPESN